MERGRCCHNNQLDTAFPHTCFTTNPGLDIVPICHLKGLRRKGRRSQLVSVAILRFTQNALLLVTLSSPVCPLSSLEVRVPGLWILVAQPTATWFKPPHRLATLCSPPFTPWPHGLNVIKQRSDPVSPLLKTHPRLPIAL